MKKDTRLDYWNNEYFQYWKKRVEEANMDQSCYSSLVKNDKPTTSDLQCFEAINLLDIALDSDVLELGCGFGRSFPYLYKKTHQITALDISIEMVMAAKENYAEMESINLLISEIEKSPFKPNSFDYVICYAVFDALYQKDALLEINRLLRKGGKVLLTGKNDNYFEDDEEALIAEINARKKGHPNYFTNINLLLEHLISFGFELECQQFFLRRGDMADNIYSQSRPEKFYSYLLVLKKCENSFYTNEENISAAFSKTFNFVERKRRVAIK